MKGLKVVLIALLVVVLLLGAGVGGFFMYKVGMFTSKNKVEKELTYSIGEVLVNLNEPGYKRYMKVKIYAAYTNQKLEAELADKTPKIRDMINDILRSKKIEDVNSQEKLTVIKKEMVDKINAALTTDKLTNIYFYDIVIQ